MVTAYTLIKAESGKDSKVLVVLKSRKEVKEVALTYGAYDLIAKIDVETSESLDEFIFDVLRKIPEVRETTTLITSRTEVMANTE
jgi:DNA-binding Lrp family transcriptional regulator